MEQYGAQIYVCGHDHNLQHGIHSNSDTSVTSNIDHILTGGGGRSLYGIKDDDAIAGLEDMGTETSECFSIQTYLTLTYQLDNRLAGLLLCRNVLGISYLTDLIEEKLFLSLFSM